MNPLIAKLRSRSPQIDFKSGTLAEFSCEIIGSRPPPRITWHLVTKSNEVIDLVSKKQSNTNSNQQQSSNIQIVDDEHFDEMTSIFHHQPPSTNQKSQSNHEKQQFKSINSHSASLSGQYNMHNSDQQINSNTNLNAIDPLSATSSTNNLINKQPFIFTIDYPLLSQDGNTSSSILKLRLSQRMHLNRLICRGQNFEVQRDNEIEDQLLLNILCKYFFFINYSSIELLCD